MDIRKITDDFAVSPQIDVDHVHEIAGAGFRSILCNRPDGEDAGQCAYETLAEAARTEGLDVRSVPIVSGMITPEALEEFRAAIDELPKPILAYCRSGTRCTMLWSVTQLGKRDNDEIVRLAAAAGYDVSGLIDQLQPR